MLSLKWIVLAIASGIGGYFSLPFEPSMIQVFALIMTSLVFWFAIARLSNHLTVNRTLVLGSVMQLGSQFLVCAALGAATAKVSTEIKSTEFYYSNRRAVTLTGQVTNIDQRRDGPRVFVSKTVKLNSGRREPIGLVRIKWRSDPVPSIGDSIEFKAILSKPSGSLVPGGFDFQRNAYFRGLSAYGFTVGKSQKVRADGEGLLQTFRLFWVRLRQTVTIRIDKHLVDQPAALAIALITNQRQRISEENLELFRKSGLAHLLAISGLHVGLVATMVFVLLRYGLALVRPLALRWKTKKIAAVAAVFFCLVYVLLTGGSIPTQRAFVMTFLVLGAVLLDRRALSARVILIAALVILLWSPEVLLSASFQMSFAAVGALIVGYEKLSARRAKAMSANKAKGSVLNFPGFSFVSQLLMSSLIATLATAPFAAFHFSLVSLGGIVANLIAIPAAALLVMPAGFLSLVLMPFGLEGFPLWAMEQGMLLIFRTAAAAADLPSFQPFRAPVPTIYLVLFSIGLFCLLTAGRRIVAMSALTAMVVITVYAIASNQRPFLVIAPDQEAIAVFASNEQGVLLGQKPGSFLREYWERAYATEFVSSLGEEQPIYNCDYNGCLLKHKKQLIAFPSTYEALKRDCAHADLIVTILFLPKDYCWGTAATIIDHRFTSKAGATTVTITQSNIAIQTAVSARGLRPWVQ